MTGFLVIAPQAIDDAHLVSSNVVETAPAAWSNVTTYAIGNTASVATTGNALDVYTSLVNANLNHAPASSPTQWKKTGSTYGVYDPAHAYALKDIVLVVATHAIYESQAAANTGNAPATDDGTHWLKVRASNKWAAFDTANSSQSTNPDSIVFTLLADGVVTGVGAANINAASARVRQIDATEGVIFDQSYSLVSDSGIDDFYPWFFVAPERRTDFAIVALHPYLGTQIEVTFSAPGETVAVGTLAVGPLQDLGGVQWGAQPGFVDNSKIAQNTWGDYDISLGSYSKIGQYGLWVDPDALDLTIRFFAENRGKPLLFQADPRWASTIVYGLVASCQPVIQTDTVVDCSLTLKGFPQ